MRDFYYFKSLCPAGVKPLLRRVEEVCDEADYEGSPLYDEYPERLFLERLAGRVLQAELPLYGEKEGRETLWEYGDGEKEGDVVRLLLLAEISGRRRNRKEN